MSRAHRRAQEAAVTAQLAAPMGGKWTDSEDSNDDDDNIEFVDSGSSSDSPQPTVAKTPSSARGMRRPALVFVLLMSE